MKYNIFVLLLISLTSSMAMAASRYNIVSYGAKPGGRTDSSKALLAAWTQACASREAATLYVPKGKFAVSKTVSFDGPCKNNAIVFQINGTLSAPSDYNVIGNSEEWIIFRHVKGVTVSGGILDGQGSGLWSCKNSGKSCPTGATSLKFANSNNIIITGLTSINSQMFHIVINECQDVTVQGAKISALEESPNTDGIHIGGSTKVNIFDSNIGTGDDCVSVGPGSSNLWIQKVICGPGHGISIGSLGKDVQEKGVRNVTVTNCTFTGTKNGVRIKTWGRPSNSFATDIHFQHAIINNVKNPIIIDQNYCDGNNNCPRQASGVKISDVTYKNIHGSSATEVAVKLTAVKRTHVDCSKTHPCSAIKLQDIELTYHNQPTKATCTNADGIALGILQPTSCL
ncbi:LOW QUALITY PROTEIN: polygalacturonase [Jatropha curcas]|uniref:LOW QUALITY PROTEIN: polygalacturonase n=1 Tax=Jatropha curcas TaxID=180498 RepID=UPI001893D18C|nr:LOW QUALITY PROTEIN: polygalacturonase [Jatropha curcas]